MPLGSDRADSGSNAESRAVIGYAVLSPCWGSEALNALGTAEKQLDETLTALDLCDAAMSISPDRSGDHEVCFAPLA